jgi:hypothetical protein
MWTYTINLKHVQKLRRDIIEICEQYFQRHDKIKCLRWRWVVAELAYCGCKVSFVRVLMEQGPSSEANSLSAGQEILRFMQLEGSLPCSQEPATGPYTNSEAVCNIL